jgi:hypothetical protein
MATEFCPRCGNRRTGSFRFCRSCGFDFDDSVATSSSPASVVPPTQSPPVPEWPTTSKAEPLRPTWTSQSQAGSGKVCGQCGKPLSPAWRGKCNHCGASYAEFPPADRESRAVGSSLTSHETPPANLAVMAGVAWLISAALTAFLAYQQWSFASAFPSNDLTTSAGWNAVAAAITLYFAARLIGSPSRSLLDRSAAWAIVSVVSGVLQIALLPGVGDLFALSVIAAAVAGVLSFVGRQQTGTPAPAVAASGPAPPVSAAATALPMPSGSRRTAERVVIALIVIAAIGGGLLVFAKMRADEILANVASAVPTIVPATQPPVGELVAMGEEVPLVDVDGNDLGSVTVVEASEPDDILGLPPAAGNRLVAVKVRYKASASWTYNLSTGLSTMPRIDSTSRLASRPSPRCPPEH